jgi:hypothetical protein
MGSVVQAMKGLAESISDEIKRALRAKKIAGGFLWRGNSNDVA